jgi:hypothetical protein
MLVTANHRRPSGSLCWLRITAFYWMEVDRKLEPITIVTANYVRYETYTTQEESYALWPRRLTMTCQFPETREQALTLLKIEREQILENFKREKKSGKRNRVANVGPLLILDRSGSSGGGESCSQ